jgi:hypothetical protein
MIYYGNASTNEVYALAYHSFMKSSSSEKFGQVFRFALGNELNKLVNESFNNKYSTIFSTNYSDEEVFKYKISNNPAKNWPEILNQIRLVRKK